MDERVLAERLITYNTAELDGIRSAAGFVKGWLEARDIAVTDYEHSGLPVVSAEIGPTDGPCVILHGHIDVVPGHPDQFEPRIEGDRLIGRGAYDMKGGLAAMMHAFADLREQRKVRVRFLCTPDEESEEIEQRSTQAIIAGGFTGDFAVTGEPTDLHIGVQAKGVLVLRVEVAGRSAHGSTPWLGDNAVLKAIEMFRAIESLPFSKESTELFNRPSINLGRISGGDALNKVPDHCTMDVDIRYLPGQDPAAVLAEVSALKDVSVTRTFTWPPAIVDPEQLYVRALREATASSSGNETLSIGRDGASDAVCFLEAGIPAVEFGPVGGGHHGPDEWVSLRSLAAYRAALREFVELLPGYLVGQSDE